MKTVLNNQQIREICRAYENGEVKRTIYERYVLCGYDSTMEENLERIKEIRKLNFQPYVMLYDKQHIKRGNELRRLQRWVNAK